MKKRREELLYEVAYLYYKEDLSKKQIGDKLEYSAAQIGRLLKEAEEKGILFITVRKSSASMLMEEKDKSAALLLVNGGLVVVGFVERLFKALRLSGATDEELLEILTDHSGLTEEIGQQILRFIRTS